MVNTLSFLAFASGAAATAYTVQVGQSGDTFSPSTVTAAIGDTVTFKFDSMHDVGSSAFGSPCKADNNIYSGIMSSGEFSIKVNSTDPIWYFCSVSHHCQSGMVGVINPPSSGNTLSAYSSAAKKTSSSEAGSDVAGGIVGDASLFGSSSSSAAGSSSSTSSAAASSADSASTAAASSGSSASSAAGSGTSVAATATGATTGSSTTAASASATKTGAASSVQAFGYAGIAAMVAAIFA